MKNLLTATAIIAGLLFVADRQQWIDVSGWFAANAMPIPGDRIGETTPENTETNRYEAFLLAHSADASNWALQNADFVAALLSVENGPLNGALISMDGARGVMQVMPGTAQWMFDIGHTRYLPDPELIQHDGVSIYFGTEYLEFLSNFGGQARSRGWIARAYVAGPGWEQVFQERTGASRAALIVEIEDYARRIDAALRRLYGPDAGLGDEASHDYGGLF